MVRGNGDVFFTFQQHFSTKSYLPCDFTLPIPQSCCLFVFLMFRGKLFQCLDPLQLLLVSIKQLIRNICSLEFHHCAGLIYHIDGLIREISIRDVTIGKPCCELKRFVRIPDAVEKLILVPQSLEYHDGLGDRWFLNHYRLETPLKRPILFDVFAILVKCCGAYDLQLSPCEHGFQHARCVE